MIPSNSVDCIAFISIDLFNVILIDYASLLIIVCIEIRLVLHSSYYRSIHFVLGFGPER